MDEEEDTISFVRMTALVVAAGMIAWTILIGWMYYSDILK
jgi:hypothetical protein